MYAHIQHIGLHASWSWLQSTDDEYDTKLQVPEAIKDNVRRLLESNPEGISVMEFKQAYQKYIGEDLILSSFGCTSLSEFVEAIPDIIE